MFCHYRFGSYKPHLLFGICENKDADQLPCNPSADQISTFVLATYSLLFKSKISSFYGCTAGFVLDLVRNLKDRFSHDRAYML